MGHEVEEMGAEHHTDHQFAKQGRETEPGYGLSAYPCEQEEDYEQGNLLKGPNRGVLVHFAAATRRQQQSHHRATTDTTGCVDSTCHALSARENAEGLPAARSCVCAPV